MNIDIQDYFDKVFIINYIFSSDERKINTKNIADKLNAKIIEGLDFSCLKDSLDDMLFSLFPYKQENDEKQKKYLRNTLSCTISHYNCLLYAKHHNYKKILILEDDVQLNEEVWYEDDFIIPEDFDIIKFVLPIDKNDPNNYTINKYFHINRTLFSNCSAGYALSDKGIEKLIDYYKKFTAPADYFLYFLNADSDLCIDKNHELNTYFCSKNFLNTNYNLANISLIA